MSDPRDLTAFASTRFSPVHFDSERVVTEQEVETLLDAARRAPSAGNSQPWAFVVGRRGDDVHRRLTRHLARSSSSWAPAAGVLFANLCQLRVEDSAIEYSEFARYDLGQAVAHLTFQAHALGLAVHQFRAFDRAGVSGEFEVPPYWEVTSMAAVGLPLGPIEAHEGAGTSRDRRSVGEITWTRATTRPSRSR